MDKPQIRFIAPICATPDPLTATSAIRVRNREPNLPEILPHQRPRNRPRLEGASFVELLHYGALPVPVSGTICGLFCALSMTVRKPLCAAPASGGVNVTDTLQLFPGANTFMH